MVQEEHQLVQVGPYRAIRHPFYAGVLLMLLGTSMVLGWVFGFIYFALSVLGLVRKSMQEEVLLVNQFPTQYPKYQSRTKMFIPKIF